MVDEKASKRNPPGPWGDPRDSRYVLQIGKRAAAAEAPWRLATEPEAPRDTVLSAGRVGPLAVRMASTRGSSHRYYGTSREDSAAAVNIDDRFAVVVVADGIGSVAGAAQAARIAVEDSVLRLVTRLRPAATPTPQLLVRHLQDAAAQANVSLNHVRGGGSPATTLTLGVVSASLDVDAGGHLFAVIGVGNSPTYVLPEVGGFRPVMGCAGSEELHSTQTAGLPTNNPQYTAHTGYLAPGSVLLLATDGLSDPLAFDDVQQELATRWRRPPDPVDFLTQVQFRRKSYDDDRSVAAVWVPKPNAEPAGDPLAGVAPEAHGRLWLPGTQMALDAGRLGNLEVRAAAIHRHRTGEAGAIDIGDDRILAAVAQAPPGLDSKPHRVLPEALHRARVLLLRHPHDPEVHLLRNIVDELSRPGIILQLAVVETAGRFAVATSDGGAAHHLTSFGVTPLLGDGGHLAAGDVLLLAADEVSVGAALGAQWAVKDLPPGPGEFLDVLRRLPGSDQAAVAIWSTAGDPR